VAALRFPQRRDGDSRSRSMFRQTHNAGLNVRMQRVLITAGAGGIGKEIARSFADVGASVFVCDIDAQGLAQLEHVLASDSAKSISGQILPIDNDMQQAS